MVGDDADDQGIPCLAIDPTQVEAFAPTACVLPRHPPTYRRERTCRPQPSHVASNNRLDPTAGIPTAHLHRLLIAAGIPAEGSPTAGDP